MDQFSWEQLSEKAQMEMAGQGAVIEATRRLVAATADLERTNQSLAAKMERLTWWVIVVTVFMAILTTAFVYK